jgi:uncharacterized membrane protein YuzA (DUF378 family)
MHNAKCCGWGHKLAKILLVIGGLNWGLVGVGMLLNSNFNVINLLLGSIPTLEAIVYILVGVVAVMKLFNCKCKKCTVGGMSSSSASVPGMDQNM